MGICRPARRGRCTKTTLDDGWLFLRGEAAGAEQPAFDASTWRKVDLPHDWSIEDLPIEAATNGSGAIWQDCNCPETAGPFSRMKSAGEASTGWTVGGVGWYRKTFAAPALPQGGRVQILFDGVYPNAELWLNGARLGKHPYGYTAFYYDVTDVLLAKADNVLAVKVSNTGKNSRWYTGSGIYRQVYLMTAGRVSIPVWGVHVQSSEISAAGANVSIAVQLANHEGQSVTATIACKLFDEQGGVVATVHSEKRLNAKSNGEAVLLAQNCAAAAMVAGYASPL